MFASLCLPAKSRYPYETVQRRDILNFSLQRLGVWVSISGPWAFKVSRTKSLGIIYAFHILLFMYKIYTFHRSFQILCCLLYNGYVLIGLRRKHVKLKVITGTNIY